jgi:RNA polymerase sigma-70 factor (ECF subfamily)
MQEGGNVMDFKELYTAHADDVYRYVLSLCGNSHIAEDVTSETFLKAIKSINNFKGDCSLRVWLCQIARNTYFNLSKRNKYAVEMSVEMLASENFELNLLDRTQAFEIHKTLRLLSEPYKEVFTLRVFAELTFAEIGELFNKSEGWSRVTFHRAKNKIMEAIEND